VGLVGGTSSSLLFLLFEQVASFRLVLYLLIGLTGTLVGLEIPLLMRILQGRYAFKDLVSQVFTFDYIGALLASIIFPLLLVPHLGLVRTSFFFGILNVAVALLVCLKFERETSWAPFLKGSALAVLGLLVAGFALSEQIMRYSESLSYPDPVIYAKSSPYQRIVLTKNGRELRLFLNGNLQFSSADEYRYHEALVHPAMALAAGGGAEVRRVLVLGGGDGLALREILKYPGVREVTLVDLDPEMTGLSRRFPPLARLNAAAFEDPRVRVVNEDAMIWLEAEAPPFDAAIVDFPDPNTYALGKLYTTRFYRLLKQRLGPGAAVSVQSTSPLFARTSYWCIVRTMEAAGFKVRPYYTAVPSFGVWGFALARREPFEVPARAPQVALKFLNDQSLAAMFTLSEDLGPVPVEINRLDNQALVRYYEAEWRRYE
jgi:spermidine synthase